MRLSRCGFRLVATCGTSKSLAEHGISAERVHKVTDGHRPNIVDLIHDGEIHIVINTTLAPRRFGTATVYVVRRCSRVCPISPRLPQLARSSMPSRPASVIGR
ncbi:MAG: hypothetical protein H6715_04600 [Myxococcales bacterium]|nr:hypothetical protein [Myxococcales bacterium]